MKRIKQCFCSILVILILTATLPTAAANGTGGVILAFDNKVLAKVGNDFSYSVTAYDFEKDREISGSFLLEIEFPKIFTVKGISFNGQRLAAGDGYYVNKNNVVKILSDFAFNGNSVTDKYLQWSIILSVAEETSEKNHMISAGRSTVLYDDDSNLIPLICKKGSICVIDRDSFKNGDVNKDLKTDSLDLSLLRKKLIGCDTADFDLLAADVNGDNTLDIRDLVALKRELVSAEYGIVYLSQTGSDIGTGGEDNPLKSFNKAMAMVSDGGTVYIIGTYSLCSDDIWNYNGKDIVISGGELDAAALDVLNIGSNVTFRNIRLLLSADEEINYGNNKVLFGENAEILRSASLLYTDEFLFGTHPTIYWSELPKGHKINISLTDSDNTVISDARGLTGTEYTCEEELSPGKEYTLKMTYTKSDGTERVVKNVGENGKRLKCISNPDSGTSEYRFNGSISFDVLNNYLGKAVTYSMCLNNSSVYDGSLIDEAIRFITNTGAKYIQRAAGEWYPTYESEKYYDAVKAKLNAAHSADPDLIFEACIFEVSGVSMNDIPIPDWVFKAFNQTPQKRCFDVQKTLFKDGYGVNYWANGYHIPDVTRLETRMFIYYRACRFIDMGFESLHLGQVGLTGKNDTDNAAYTKLIGMIRDYAKTHARRNYVLINAHKNEFRAPDGTMLADMIVSPARMHAKNGETRHEISETNPQRCIIDPEYWKGSSVYKSGISGTSPSGWYAEKYPYIVEIDNYSIDGEQDTTNPNAYVWGKDEITWFVLQPQWYRHEFMNYLISTINGYNENGHVALVGHRGGNYYANDRSVLCTGGAGDETVIKQILQKR